MQNFVFHCTLCHAKRRNGGDIIADLLDLKLDYVFKRTFGYQGDEPVTSVLLKDLLNIDITKINLTGTTITEKELLDDKVGILDIKAIINENTQCDIEMQFVSQNNIIERLLFYWGKLYTQAIKQGYGYETAKKTIVILFANFELKGLELLQKYVTKWHIREDEYTSVVLTDTFEAVILELPKFVKYADKSKSKNLDLWVKFIENPGVKFMDEKNDEELKETVEAIENAQKKLEQLSNDEHERELADLREKYIRDQYSIEQSGYERGIEDGKAAGIAEGQSLGKKLEKLETAKAMLEEGFDISTISKITKLSEDEISKLIK